MESEAGENGTVLETITAILIALVVVIGAIVAWRASVSDDAAGDADYAGLRAAVNTEQTRAINAVNAYQSNNNYLSFWYNKRWGDLISSDLKTTTDEAQKEILNSQLATSQDLARADMLTFDPRFRNRDNSYDVGRQIGEMWADALKEKDMDFETQFTLAEQMRKKTIYLLLCVMVLGIAPVFFSLVETVDSKSKYLIFGIGSIIALTGTVLSILVEFGVIS